MNTFIQFLAILIHKEFLINGSTLLLVNSSNLIYKGAHSLNPKMIGNEKKFDDEKCVKREVHQLYNGNTKY